MIVMVRNNKVLTSRHEKAPESFDSEVSDSRLLYLGEIF